MICELRPHSRPATAMRPGPGRGRLDLSHAGVSVPCCTRVWKANRERSARLPQVRLRALPVPGRQGQTKERRHHGDRPRDGGLRLGHRPADQIGTGAVTDPNRNRARSFTTTAPKSAVAHGRRRNSVGRNPRLLYIAGYDQRRRLDRGKHGTHIRSCGNQPAHQNLINRRHSAPSPAMHDRVEPSSNPRCRG